MPKADEPLHFCVFAPGPKEGDPNVLVEFDWRQLEEKARSVTKLIPNRLSVEPGSPYYSGIFIRRAEVYLDGRLAPRVIEYSISGGWIRQHRVMTNKVRVSREGIVPAFKRFGEVAVILKDYAPTPTPADAPGEGTVDGRER